MNNILISRSAPQKMAAPLLRLEWDSRFMPSALFQTGRAANMPAHPDNSCSVATDYNFSFMVIDALGLFNGPNSPFGAQPGMIHLASYREGIVEQFRGTRAINTPFAC